MPDVLKRVGRYDLVEIIGRGGAAVVYLAQQRDLMRSVALKELAPFQAADMSFAERFVEESRLAGSMNHANIVTVHEYFEDGGVPYIAMEYLPHGSLRQYVGRLSTAQIAAVLEGVLAGLSHGEARGIAHRDLKPENLLVAVDGRVKIADFGVARAYNKAATRAVVTVAGTTIGTPAYMSPEQALGADLTPATDLYSLGVVAWELLAGQVPFEESDTPVAVLYRHVHEPIPSVRTVAPEVDERVAAWLERMLAKQPEDRFPGADAAWVALEDVILDLLGPRWRREARLVVDDGDARHEHTLPPASFAAVPADAAANNGVVTPVPDPARAPIAETLTGNGAPAAVPPTVAPKTRRRRSNTTLMRIARRHADSDAEAPAPASTRRRLTVAAIVLTMIAAAVAGVVLAQPGRHAHRPSAAELRAREQAAAVAAARRQLTAVIVKLAPARNRALTQLQGASTAREQLAAATALEKAYATAASQASQVRGATANGIHAMLERMAVAYGRLAAAARAQSAQQWADAQHAISAQEQQLRSAVAKL
jgi:Protein kinase domain